MLLETLSGGSLAQEALPSWLAWQEMAPPYGGRKIACHPLNIAAWALDNENQAKANSFSAICWLSHPRVWDCTARAALLWLSSRQNEHRSWQVKSSPRPQGLPYKGPGLISDQVCNPFICTVMNSELSRQEVWALEGVLQVQGVT